MRINLLRKLLLNNQNTVQPHAVVPQPPQVTTSSTQAAQQQNHSFLRRQSTSSSITPVEEEEGKTTSSSEDIFSLLGHAKLRKLKAWFHLVDLNGDNDLSEKEINVFFQILHIDPPPLRRKHQGMSFEQLMKEHGHLILEIELEMPGNDFFQKCKKLKQGFRKCDSDGNMEISIQEFEIATQKLGIMLCDEELERVFDALDMDGDKRIDWSEFVKAATQNTIGQVSNSLGNFFDIESFSDLPSFLRPQEMAPTDQQGNNNGSRLETYGVKFLTKIHKERLEVVKRASTSVTDAMLIKKIRAAKTQNDQKTMTRVKRTELLAVVIGSAAGLICGLVSIGLESLIVDTDGFLYYLYLFLLNIFISIIEVNAMYITAVLCAFKLTIITKLTLYPQDAEREFLTRSIARAALQVGHSKDKIFGIDPMKGSPKLVLLLSFLIYKTKRYAIKIVLKFLIKRVLWRAAAKVALSLMVLPVNGILNAWTIRRVMRNCRINILGPPAAVSVLELFFLEDDAFSPSQRVDYLRAIASCLVCKRCVHPNVQILLQHARKWLLSVEKWTREPGCTCLQDPQETCPTHMFDDFNLFYRGLEQLAAVIESEDKMTEQQQQFLHKTQDITIPETSHANTMTSHEQGDGYGLEQERSIDSFEHRRNIFFLIVITLIIDGGLDWAERKFYVQACIAAGMRNEWKQIMKIKDDLVEGKGISMDRVFGTIEELDQEEIQEMDQKQKLLLHRTPFLESLRFFGNRLSSLLSV